MLRRVTFAIIAALLPVLQAAAFVKQTTPSAAGDRWQVDVSLGTCTLSRTYSSMAGTRLKLSTAVGTDQYLLAITDRRLPVTNELWASSAQIKVDGKTVATDYITIFHDTKTGKPEAFVAGLGLTLVQAFGQGSQLSLRYDRGKIGPLPLPQASAAIAALEKCEAGQLTEWGADPLQFAPGGTRAKVHSTQELVPQHIMRSITHTRSGPIKPLHYLVIGAEGRVERCASVYGIPGSNFEEVVCGYLTGRKVGTPARDAAGNVVRGVVGVEPAVIRTAVSQ